MMQPDTQRPSVSDQPRRTAPVGFEVFALIGLCCLVELVLTAADFGLIGTARWRGLAYQNGAFWSGLLYDWRPNYAAQPWVMFLTYSFLHTGVWHLVGNMLTLAFLGPFVRERTGQVGFLMIYAVSAIGGGAGFAMISKSPQPMVGASGALFGLAGALLYWDWSDRHRAGKRLWPVSRTILFLAALNMGMWAMLDGVLAWETHLAGFIAGWVAAMTLSWRS